MFKPVLAFGIGREREIERRRGGGDDRRGEELRFPPIPCNSKPWWVLQMQIHGPQPHPRQSEPSGTGLGIWQGGIFASSPCDEGHQLKVGDHCSIPKAKPEPYSQSLHVGKISSARRDSPEFLSDILGREVPSGFQSFLKFS